MVWHLSQDLGYGLVCGNEEDAQETILLSCNKEGPSMVLHILCDPLSRLLRKAVVKFSIHWCSMGGLLGAYLTDAWMQDPIIARVSVGRAESAISESGCVKWCFVVCRQEWFPCLFHLHIFLLLSLLLLSRAPCIMSSHLLKVNYPKWNLGCQWLAHLGSTIHIQSGCSWGKGLITSHHILQSGYWVGILCSNILCFLKKCGYLSKKEKRWHW
jgi:hypothetical protein